MNFTFDRSTNFYKKKNLFNNYYKRYKYPSPASSRIIKRKNKMLDEIFNKSNSYEMINFLKEIGLSEKEILEGCQKKGGLLGISGVSNDLRYVNEAANNGNKRAKLAVDVFVTGIVHYIGSFFMDLGGLTDLVFTAGIGENSKDFRKAILDRLAWLGISYDETKNAFLKSFSSMNLSSKLLSTKNPIAFS